MTEAKKKEDLDQELVLLIKAAGFYLNKNIGGGRLEDASRLFSTLNEKEKTVFAKLLRKTIKVWKV